MRMWMCNPQVLCQRHLLGEHVETHMFLGTIRKGISVQGYLDRNLLEPVSLLDRHRDLADELVRRGLNHQSPMPTLNWYHYRLIKLPDVKIDRERALQDLLGRCSQCRERFRDLNCSVN